MNWTLLSKYLSGECSLAEEEKVARWLDASSDNRAYFDTLLEVWSVKPEDNIEINGQLAWDTIKGKLDEENKRKSLSLQFKGNHSVRQTRAKNQGRYGFWPASAAVAAIVVVAVILYFGLIDVGPGERQQAGKKQEFQEVSTEPGQRTSFYLADGTQVRLNADSRIQILPSFGDSIRGLRLKGEAYFDVAANPEVPFLVYTEDSYTRVLGTKFGVRAYPGDQKMRVAVAEGEVALGFSEENSTESLHLTRNKIGILDSDKEIKVKETGDIENCLAWKDGWLVFRSTPFDEVIPRLERWYNIEIAADASLSGQKITATFKEEPMLEVLNILALSLDAKFKKTGRKIIFSSNNLI